METITAARLYLMTRYARTGCPRLAVWTNACEGAAPTATGDEQIH